MSNINDVKNIMELDRWFPMCDVGEIGEDYIHLISWNEDIPKTDFDTIAELIANDGYDVSAFELLDIAQTMTLIIQFILDKSVKF